MEFRLSALFRLDAAGRAVLQPAEPTIDEAGRCYHAGDLAAAARICDAILARWPAEFDTLHLRGVLLLRQQNYEQALDFLRRAEAVRPDVAQLAFNIGNALSGLQRFGEAAAAFRRALVLRPGDVDAMNNLGNALLKDDRAAEAVACFEQALALRPGAAQAQYNLGRALLALDRVDEASDRFRAALASAGPDTEHERLLDLYTSRSEVLVRQRRYADALAVGAGAPPEIANAPAMLWNDSLTLLMLGRLAEGWRNYEHRFEVAGHDPPRAGASVLDLDTVAGRRVLVFHEQGRGDMLQFCRYLPMLAARGAIVLVETYPDLVPLFSAIAGVAQVVAETDPPPRHDLLTPLMSLPLAFATTLETIPAAVPYLRAPPARRERWAAMLGARAHPRVGIAWAGSQQSAPRSAMPLAALAPVLAMPGRQFHVLQKDIAPADRARLQAHGNAVCHDAMLGDFADTAALIEQMDLVISIDTAVAHLAGALARPVWIMLGFSPDWRWLCDRDDSPWYPTARLFRQEKRGDWSDVVRRVVAALSDW